MCWFWKRKVILPHPEEPRNAGAFIAIDISRLKQEWEKKWHVPSQFWPFWETVPVITSTDMGEYPELTYASPKKIMLRPDYANPGVLAHAAAHVSWGLMPEADRVDFEFVYNALKDKGLVKALREQHPYADANINEAHSEVYRFLGAEMPEPLRAFYPNLIEV